jgi:hypothetical protein
LFRENEFTERFWLRDQRRIESSSFSSLVLVLDYDYEDDDEDDINKNAFNSAKRGMKAFDEFRQKQSGEPASSFSLRRSAPNVGPTSTAKPIS